jgi:hypothetical protein
MSVNQQGGTIMRRVLTMLGVGLSALAMAACGGSFRMIHTGVPSDGGQAAFSAAATRAGCTSSLESDGINVTCPDGHFGATPASDGTMLAGCSGDRRACEDVVTRVVAARPAS